MMFPWVFNVADSGITIGVVLLLIDSLFGDRRKGALKRAGARRPFRGYLNSFFVAGGGPTEP